MSDLVDIILHTLAGTGLKFKWVALASFEDNRINVPHLLNYYIKFNTEEKKEKTEGGGGGGEWMM